jgi:hypothetical protein
LVIHHEDRKDDFKNLSIRLKRSAKSALKEKVIFKSSADVFQDEFEEEKIKAAIEQSNCIILWVSGNEFFPVWEKFKPNILQMQSSMEKEILLVNVNESEEDFQRDYNSCFESPVCYPADDAAFTSLPGSWTFERLVNFYEGNKNDVLDHFLEFFNTNLVTFHDKLLESLRKFDYTLQRNQVLNGVKPEDKFVFLLLNGTEQCGLEILANHIVEKMGDQEKSVRLVDFDILEFHFLNDLLSGMRGGPAMAREDSFRDWLEAAFQNNGSVFYVFQNFLTPGLSEQKADLHIGLIDKLRNELEKADLRESWKGRIFFLLLNKSDRAISSIGEKCKVIDLPPIIKLDPDSRMPKKR